jgi:beta-lactamase superfamily II metal-dependent hydrolase
MSKKKPPPASGGRLLPPEDGAAVRFYRIGHGDCFLLAFPGTTKAKPVYVLIDCGYKPGSPGKIVPPTSVDDIVDNIREATGGHLDVAVITHEHQDHVNGITEGRFHDLTIGESWFAWTEKPDDDLANQLRKQFKDKLLGLLGARSKLELAGDMRRMSRVDDFLALELGGDGDALTPAMLAAAATDPANSVNKKAMKVFKDRADAGPQYLFPHGPIRKLPGTNHVRVFVLGPPHDWGKLKSLDPEGDEEFHSFSLAGDAMSSTASYFAASARTDANAEPAESPFERRFCLGWDEARDAKQGPLAQFFLTHYGTESTEAAVPPGGHEASTNAAWRRIDHDWLRSADTLALALGDYTNNSSIVLAFELGKGGKVLLFAADAQRGNWMSWADKTWKDGTETVTARDLLERTVLYKVGHHGSHNATLNGTASDTHPCLAWMGANGLGHEFTAMITAVPAWAETQKGWNHPLPAIKDALLKKAAGRVFQTDTPFAKMAVTSGGSKADWKAFKSRAAGTDLYFDYRIEP